MHLTRVRCADASEARWTGRVMAWCAVMCCAASWACAGDPQPPTTQVRDSLGITIAESTAPSLPPPEMWRVDSVPFLAVDGAEPAYQLTWVTGATRLDDGSVVLSDRDTREIRLFDPAGTFVRAVGRDGDGPGEFRQPSSVNRFRGDSLIVFDEVLRRATVYDQDLNLGRVLTLAGELQVQQLLPLGPNLLLAKAWDFGSFLQVAGAYRSRYLLATFDADGALVDTLGTMPGWNGYKVNREGGGYTDMAALFPVNGQVATWDTTVIVGPADVMEFSRLDPHGQVRQIVRGPAPAPLDPGEVRDERAARIRPNSSDRVRRMVEELPPPEHRPAYRELLVDPRGDVWLGRYRSMKREADAPITWEVFAPDGTWLGSARTPARFRVLEIGTDYVLGTRRDELDVEQLQLLRIRR